MSTISEAQSEAEFREHVQGGRPARLKRVRDFEATHARCLSRAAAGTLPVHIAAFSPSGSFPAVARSAVWWPMTLASATARTALWYTSGAALGTSSGQTTARPGDIGRVADLLPAKSLLQAVGMWLSSAPPVRDEPEFASWLHWDARGDHNFLQVLSGAKEVRLIAPGPDVPALPFPLHFLAARDARELAGLGSTVLLEPGDVLYVPRCWWHYVVHKGRFNCSISVWWKHEHEHAPGRLEYARGTWRATNVNGVLLMLKVLSAFVFAKLVIQPMICAAHCLSKFRDWLDLPRVTGAAPGAKLRGPAARRAFRELF